MSPPRISPVTLRKGASGQWEQGKLCWHPMAAGSGCFLSPYTRHCQGEQLPLPKPQEDLYLAGLCIPAGTSQHSRLGQQHVAQIFPESNHKTGISYEHLNEKKRKEREEKPPRAQRTQIRLLGMDRQQLSKFLYFIFSTFLNTRHRFPPSLNTPVPS